jgi:uncharacterized protein YndB with AHSA1/START domain/DNA-binding transcriptional ArsR family regulator
MANDVFKALAHPTRREIVERLSGGPATVAEVARGFEVSKPTISRHLRLLEEAGVVSRVIVGRNHRLALDARTLAETADWIETQRARLERLFDVVEEYLEERKEPMAAERELRIERTFDAPAERVFDAWTDPEVMRRWYHAGPDWETPEVEVDPRVGGKVRVVMRRPDGTEVSLSGTYTEIERPQRLAMTCTFSDDPDRAEQLIELSFSETDGTTTVVLVNSRIPTDERRDAQQWGWGRCFDELDGALRS